MRSEQEVLQRLILDTVALLCRNTLTYQSSLQVQGLIGVTLDSNVFIIHFDEKFDGSTVKETSESKASSGEVFGLEGFEVESNSTETHTPLLPVAQPTIQRKACMQTRWSQENSRECRPRRNLVQPSSKDASADIFACDPVKEEISRVPVFPQPWPGFQNEPAESSTIPEGRSHIQLTPKTEINFMESETASSESKTFVSRRSQNSCDVLEGTQYIGGGGNSSFQPDFSPSTEFVGFQEPLRKPQRKGWKPSCDLRDNFNKAAPGSSAPYIITKALHICAYPSCGKQFHHRHHLLRHQTMKHNRAPTKRRHAAFLHSSSDDVPDLPLESSSDGLEQSLTAYKTFGADQSSSW